MAPAAIPDDLLCSFIPWKCVPRAQVFRCGGQEHDQQDQGNTDERISRVIDLINHRLGEELNIETLAGESGLSPSRFAHLFRERMGVTPMNFLESRRMEQAKQLLLASGLSIQEIGLKVGFANAQHFSTRFRKNAGQSPSPFRHAPRRRFGELYPMGDSS